ncbi:DegV family protein [Pseudomarimonas salicorniae]|uniref:DegV family EDD domain-containing protein n=1 Tax=Pseudomarimonas salicorniae TaxID=2933270 RepID=A0ABT0GE03_9GAMM|nr:DegV family protein [Lysobacter sp. CAU 1642]MCK7592242.1 DegV family EDD domain-containing protein [Lysobacter sp. CAU 1642]
MAAISHDIPFEQGPRVSAIGLRRALIAGMRRVIERRELLNRINVFPVPDGDTGSNLAFTLNAVLSGSLSRRSRSAGALLRAVADDAIDGARGNSGAILAQFLCGASEAVGDAAQLSSARIARAVRAGSEQARGALAQPREGTILSVIRAFAEALEAPRRDLNAWFGHAVDKAREALAETPRQLAVLRQAGVVDAGAQGFVDLIEGIHGFIARRELRPAPPDLGNTQEFAGDHWHDEADASRPWCSECLIEAEAIDRQALQRMLQQSGAASVVVAGTARRVRLHAHVADPGRMFEIAGDFGAVSARKAEDMRAQFRATQRQGQVAIVTDSAADLPAGITEQLPIDVVPVRVSFGAEDFLDRVSLSNAEFYARLRGGGVLPQTSQPPPGDFRRQFELLLSHAEEVVYIGLSRQLSGTLQSGEAAAERCGGTRVTVIDSVQASCGQALLVMAAAELARRGAGVADIRARLDALGPKTFTFAAARDISHAVRGGRVPGWVLPLASRFGLTAIARMKPSGKLSVAGALFGGARVPERFARYVERRLPRAPQWRVMVGHCDAPAEAEALLAALRQRLPISRDWLVETGPAIGAHAGPGTLVVSAQVETEVAR